MYCIAESDVRLVLVTGRSHQVNPPAAVVMARAVHREPGHLPPLHFPNSLFVGHFPPAIHCDSITIGLMEKSRKTGDGIEKIG